MLSTVSPGGRPIDETPFSTSRTSNFVARGGGLPPYVRGVAHAIMRERGIKDESQAIQIAIGEMKNWASGQGRVHPQVRTAAAAAVAEWEALKAKAHANLAVTDKEAIDLAMKGALPPLPGSSKPRYPIKNHDDLKKAIRAVGRAKTGHAAIRRHIVARAKAIGGTHLIPDNWTSTGNFK